MARLALLSALLLLVPVAGQRAAPLRVGHTEDWSLRLPQGPPDRSEGSTTIWERTLRHVDATWLRVEPVLLRFGPGAELVIRDADGREVDRFDASTDLRWSRAVAGATLRLELRVPRSIPATEVVIARAGIGEAIPPSPQAICPGSTLLPIACSASLIPTLPGLGRAVARLNILMSNGTWCLGTGFNADLTAYGGNATQFMLTAGHNVTGVPPSCPGPATFIEAQYLAVIPQANCAAPVTGDRCSFASQVACSWLKPDPACDWAVVSFRNPVGALYGSLPLAPVPTFRSVVVVQHPQGRCQEYSTGFFPNFSPPCEFAHTASTEAGSSGSPVFAYIIPPSAYQVIGVHVASTGGACPNLATATDSIFPFLTPPLLQSLLSWPTYTVIGSSSGAIGGCTPRLVANCAPRIGSPWSLATLSIPSTALVAWWLGPALSPPNPPVYVSPVVNLGPWPAQGPGYPCDGHAGIPIPVPNSTYLRGAVVSAQSLVFQSASFVLTNGITATIQ